MRIIKKSVLVIICLLLAACASDADKPVPVQSVGNEAVLLAALPEKDIYLYEHASESGEPAVALHIGNVMRFFDWSYMTPRGIQPLMHAGDFNGDGVDELAVVLYVGSGSGVSVEQLHVLESDVDRSHPAYFQDYMLEPGDHLDVLRQAVDGQTAVGDDGQLVNIAGDQAVFGNIVRFETEADSLRAAFGVGVAVERSPAPLHAGLVYADVYYNDGAFTLDNVRFEAER